ncbi:30S ribosomal protein S6e [Candidatus Micrarchaeota archaeon CG1_02_47_40]|nr:MAG: 30S ribosomal protein S6e [Candidatus Micrarchaeota archaeon CG1_02_47_40]
MKVVISDKNGKSYQAELPPERISSLLGMKIGDEVEGAFVGAAGYKLKITGGSDNSGFPMREDVSGPRRMSILISSGTGFRPTEKGERARKTVHGNQLDAEIAQLNTIVIQEGPQKLEELFKPKEGEKKEKKEKKKEEKKPKKKK